MMVTDESYKKKNRRERLLFLVKLMAYGVLEYLILEPPASFTLFPALLKITKALSFFLGANLIISFAWIFIMSWYTRRHRNKPIEKDNFILGLNRIASVFNTISLILAVMTGLGIDLLQFMTGISIVAAAIALLSKDYITNMINGLIIMFSDQLSLGDHVRIGEYKGKILDITLINIVLQNEDDEIMIIPNSLVFTSIVTNLSKQHVKKVSIEFELDSKRIITPTQLETRLRSAIDAYAEHFVSDSFLLRTMGIKKDYVQFKVQLVMPAANKETERQIRRTLNTAIIAIAENGV